MPDNQLKQRVRWDVYLLVLRAAAMFIMAAHSLYFILVPFMALLLSYFEIWPERVLVRFSAIRHASGNTIRTEKAKAEMSNRGLRGYRGCEDDFI